MKLLSFYHVLLRLIITFLGTLNLNSLQAQAIVTYAGNEGDEVFYDVMQLSNGTFLVAGSATNLNWIPADVPKTQLGNTDGINNGQGSNRFGFLLQLRDNFQEILHVVHFAQGAVEDIRYLKTTNIPGQTTGEIYLSGNTTDTKANDGGYFIAKLDNNFVNGIPGALVWAKSIWAEGYPEEYQPWDVGNDGKVVYIGGQSHAYDWSAIYRLNQNGQQERVNNWRTHWKVGGGEWRGTPAATYPGGIDSIAYSGIVLKKWGRCDLRSWSSSDFNQILPDGNGGTKKGLWPLDAFYNSPCNPDSPNDNGPGYTGYSTSGTPVYGGSVVCIDRRNNHIYFGMNIKTVLPDGNPDFEPSLIAMTETGELKWWSRIYHEIKPDGTYMLSTPDQYVDALAIDYSQPYTDAFLVVNARCHGNNVENLWEGNEIAANPAANGFQNRFTGTNGNIHISWLGKLQLNNGVLMNSTYVAEYAEGTGSLGTPHPNPNLDNWPNPNTGWPDVNTTRLAKNNLKVTADGSVCVVGVGRRTITTANAYQKMVLPTYGGASCWNSFVRVYSNDLSIPLYSSLVVGGWDTISQAGGGNTDLYGIWKTTSGVVAVGRQSKNTTTGQPNGNPIPVTNAPAWGNTTPNAKSAIFVYYPASNLINPNDGFASTPSVTFQAKALLQGAYNPTTQLMTTSLNINNLLPLTQPFNTPPWNYTGTETAVSMPANAVDWVLLEVRNVAFELVAARAALMLDNGLIIDANGNPDGVAFDNLISGYNYYLAIKHRNHAAVVSSTMITLPNPNPYDFTTPNNVQHGNTQLELAGNGLFAMKAGDFNADGVITFADGIGYFLQFNTSNQYTNTDTNLDGTVNIADFNLFRGNVGHIGLDTIRY